LIIAVVDGQEQIEFLRVELVIIGEVITEQGKGLHGGTATRGDLHATPTGDRIGDGELLESPHGIVGADDAGGAAEGDPGGGGGRRCDQRTGGGHGHGGGVVFTDTEIIQSLPVRED